MPKFKDANVTAYKRAHDESEDALNLFKEQLKSAQVIVNTGGILGAEGNGDNSDKLDMTRIPMYFKTGDEKNKAVSQVMAMYRVDFLKAVDILDGRSPIPQGGN